MLTAETCLKQASARRKRNHSKRFGVCLRVCPPLTNFVKLFVFNKLTIAL